MMSRPARYSAAVAGSSWMGGMLAGRSVRVVRADGGVGHGRSPVGPKQGPVADEDAATGPEGLFVGDDRADPVAQAGVAPDQPDGVDDRHHDDAQGRVR